MESIVKDSYGYDLVYLGDKIQRVEYNKKGVERIVMTFTWKGNRVVDIKCFTPKISFHIITLENILLNMFIAI